MLGAKAWPHMESDGITYDILSIGQNSFFCDTIHNPFNAPENRLGQVPKPAEPTESREAQKLGRKKHRPFCQREILAKHELY